MWYNGNKLEKGGESKETDEKGTECGHKNSISSDDIYKSEEEFRNYTDD